LVGSRLGREEQFHLEGKLGSGSSSLRTGQP
jgi:hypothetical protein